MPVAYKFNNELEIKIEQLRTSNNITIEDFTPLRDKIVASIALDRNAFDTDDKVFAAFDADVKSYLAKKIVDNAQGTKKENKHKLSHAFTWPLPMDLQGFNPADYMMVKGVAMTEGEMKRGEIMTKDNLTFATGAMSAAAMLGLCYCDIDHYEAELPKQYVEKYGKEINNNYPPVIIIDAGIEVNEVEPGKQKLAQVEWYGFCTNPLVYKMIANGKFKGNSVVDWYRHESCAYCDGKTGKCNCVIEGSHFLRNTLILDEVPNSHATWVDIVTNDDIGTIIAKPNQEAKLSLDKLMSSHPQLKAKFKFLQLAHSMQQKMKLDEYQNSDGTWKEGLEGINAYLKDEKSIDDTTAKDIAEYLFAHPEALTQYQYEFMSGQDLVAWFTHITNKENSAKIYIMQKQLAALNALRHNAEGLAILRNIDQYGKDEVQYGDKDQGMQCANCRWFFAFDPFNIATSPGACAIVNGDVSGNKGCNKHEVAGAQNTADIKVDVNTNTSTAADTTQITVNQVQGEDVNKNADTMDPDAEGNCADGYKKVDGMCVKEDSAKYQEYLKKQALDIVNNGTDKPAPTVKIDKDSEPDKKAALQKLDEEIAKIQNKIKDNKSGLIPMTPFGMKKQAEHMRLNKELKRLENLKKKLA